jgi:aminoglycoside phosphotransferase (APT) family kinase protein
VSPIDAPLVAWVSSVVDRSVVSVEPLSIGASSRVYRCGLADGRHVVLRQIVDRAWLEREPDLIAREVAALRILEGSDVPVPRSLGALPERGLGLSTWVEGKTLLDADGLRSKATALARLTGAIARIELPADHPFAAWRSWVPRDVHVPEGGDSVLWHRAIEAYAARERPAAATSVLLHRDLHPMNVLWEGGSVVGVVDWVNACVGHPHAELGNCRWNLAVLSGIDTAEAYLAAYPHGHDGDYDPIWDLEAILGRTADPIVPGFWDSVGRPDLGVREVLGASEALLRMALGRL